MPRISPPTSSKAVSQRPREYALLQLLSPNGDVPDEKFKALLAEYGQAKEAGSDLSFDKFAALFQKPPTETSEGEGNAVAFACFDAKGPFKPWRFNRRATGPKDVRIQIAYAGICHSDIHTARSEWGPAKYPCVPGHEIVGVVTEVGPEVTQFRPGQRVGVGTLVNSCGKCTSCSEMKTEQYCLDGLTMTYNSTDPIDGTTTYGGYSSHIVVTEHFVFNIPEKLNFADAAPLLCAGITVYSPIKHYGFDKPGSKIGIVGLGGLGHLAVKILKAMNIHVTVISTSTNKKEEATSVLGADDFLVSKDEEQMKAAAGTLDGIIDTVAADHPLEPLFALLKVDSSLCMIGLSGKPLQVPGASLIMQRKRLVGSCVGGVKETQEMLDFCAEKGVACMTEHIKAQDINTAYERMIKSDVRYRFVIDILDSLVQ